MGNQLDLLEGIRLQTRLSYVSISEEEVTFSTTPSGLTLPANCDAVLIQVQSGDLRFTLDGVTAPTASAGLLLTTGQGSNSEEPYFTVSSWTNLQNFSARAQSGSCTCWLVYARIPTLQEHYGPHQFT